MSKFHVIVSAENNPYMAWQCQLFHYSCTSRVGLTPTFFVHDSGEEWHSGFRDIVGAGGFVRGVPSYALTAGTYIYPPRNTPGTLLHAAEVFKDPDDYLVLCDPDMIFLGNARFPVPLSANFYSYMNYDDDRTLLAAERCGVSPNEILNRDELRCGVPYLIAATSAKQLAETWLDCIDQFPEGMWEVSMYAFGLAVVRLKIPISLTHLVGLEYRMGERPDGQMIHYCYSGDLWDKRVFVTEQDAQRVWAAEGDAPDGTIMAEILAQIREARNFYSRLGI